jgi:uncharacterized membrane protein
MQVKIYQQFFFLIYVMKKKLSTTIFSSKKNIKKTNVIHMILKLQNEAVHYEKTMQSIEEALNCKKKRKKGAYRRQKSIPCRMP